jgi:flagellar motor switch protein FliN/FliY
MAEPAPNDEAHAAAAAPDNPAVTTADSPAAAPATERPPESGIDAELSALPVHARSILKVRVPLQVTLAAQRKSVQEIIELGPGSIVKFDKTCDQPLELMLGDRPLAHGEVVKVGDKFGLRIRGLVKS